MDEQVFGEPTSTCRHFREPPLSTDTAAVRSAWNSPLSLFFSVNRPELTFFSEIRSLFDGVHDFSRLM